MRGEVGHSGRLNFDWKPGIAIRSELHRTKVHCFVGEVMQTKQTSALEPQHARKAGFYGLERCGAEFRMRLALLDKTAQAVEKRGVVGKLLLHRNPHATDDGTAGVCGCTETSTLAGLPLHRSTHGVTVRELRGIIHANLIAVIKERCTGQRHEEGVKELNLAVIIAQQGCQASRDAHVGTHLIIGQVVLVHEGALVLIDHLQRQLVVVAQEGSPLAALG